MAMYKHAPSHLDIEQPLFQGKPHIWIQWKGTNVCCDIICSCGANMHFDGDFMYFIKCINCQKVWEVGTHISLHEPNPDTLKHVIVQEPEGD